MKYRGPIRGFSRMALAPNYAKPLRLHEKVLVTKHWNKIYDEFFENQYSDFVNARAKALHKLRHLCRYRIKIRRP